MIGDAIAGLDAERDQPERESLDLVAIFPPGYFLIEAEVLVAKRDGIGSRRHALEKKLRHALAIDRPGSILVMLRNILPETLHSPLHERPGLQHSSITMF